MKKELIFITLLSLFCGCSTSLNESLDDILADGDFLIRLSAPEYEDSDILNVVSTRSYLQLEGASSNKFQFFYENNDSVGIFPSGGYQIPFVVSGLPEAGSMSGATINAGSWRTNPEITYACYLPFDYNNRNGEAIPFSYAGQVQVGNNGTAHLADYTLMVSNATVSNANQSFDFRMRDTGASIRIKATVSSSANYRKIEVIRETGEKLFVTRGTYNLFAEGTLADPYSTPSSTASFISMKLGHMVGDNFVEGVEVSAGEVLIANFKISPCTLTSGAYICKLYDTSNNVYVSSFNLPSNVSFAEGQYGAMPFSGFTVSSSSETTNSSNLNNALQNASSSSSVDLNVAGNDNISTITIPSSLTTTDDASIALSFEQVPSAGNADNMITVSETSNDDESNTKHSNVEIAIPSAKENNAEIPSLNILLPHSTVTLSAVNGAAEYSTVNSTTAENTLVIESGVVVTNLHIYGGNVIIKEGAIVYNVFDHTGGKSSITNWNDGGSTEGEVNAEISGFQSGN